MRKKSHFGFLGHTLMIVLMCSFVTSSIFPNCIWEDKNVNIEESDFDEQESSEEKKGDEEDKDSYRNVVPTLSPRLIDAKNVLTCQIQIPKLSALYLPVITPPPDWAATSC